MKKILVLLAVWPLAACINFRQAPLPGNYAVASTYPQAAAGDQRAALWLAENYRSDKGGIERNDGESLRRWLDLAERGNSDAQLALAAYAQPGNRELAVYWYLRAAEAGNRRALGALAGFYADSRNGPPDYPNALKWAYAAGNTYQINAYQKQLTPEAQAEAKRQAEEWKSRQPAKEKQ